MATINEQILTAMKATLLGNTPAGERVYRSRVQAMSSDEMPAIDLRPVEESTQRSHQTTGHTLQVEVAVHARGAIADQAADTTVQQAVEKLLADPTLSDLVAAVVDDGRDWQFADADVPACMVRCRFLVKYQTPASSLSRTI